MQQSNMMSALFVEGETHMPRFYVDKGETANLGSTLVQCHRDHVELLGVLADIAPLCETIKCTKAMSPKSANRTKQFGVTFRFVAAVKDSSLYERLTSLRDKGDLKPWSAILKKEYWWTEDQLHFRLTDKNGDVTEEEVTIVIEKEAEFGGSRRR